MEHLEFAELLCNRVTVKSTEGPVPMFTMQFLVYPQRGATLCDPELLPLMHVSVHQAPHMLEALRLAIAKYLPEAQIEPSDSGSSGMTPSALN